MKRIAALALLCLTLTGCGPNREGAVEAYLDRLKSESFSAVGTFKDTTQHGRQVSFESVFERDTRGNITKCSTLTQRLGRTIKQYMEYSDGHWTKYVSTDGVVEDLSFDGGLEATATSLTFFLLEGYGYQKDEEGDTYNLNDVVRDTFIEEITIAYLPTYNATDIKVKEVSSSFDFDGKEITEVRYSLSADCKFELSYNVFEDASPEIDVTFHYQDIGTAKAVRVEPS